MSEKVARKLYKVSTLVDQKKIVLLCFSSFYRYSVLENDMIFPADSESRLIFFLTARTGCKFFFLSFDEGKDQYCKKSLNESIQFFFPCLNKRA